MKVIKWICADELNEQYKEADYNEYCEDAIIKELVNNQYIICGDTHQCICIPIFEDNKYIVLSMRKWGEVMAKAMNLIEGSDKYDYKDFYLVSLCKHQEKLPIK